MITDNNNTPIRPSVIQAIGKPIRLEMLIASMDDWRLNKKKLNERIPEKIWDQVFALITTPEPSVLKALGISQGQFIREKLDRKTPPISPVNINEEITGSSIHQVNSSIREPNRSETTLKNQVFPKPALVTDAVSKDVEFCEVKPAPYPLVGKPAKAFSTETCVVELYRPDGMLMKIHMCTDRFDELLTAFANGNGGIKC